MNAKPILNQWLDPDDYLILGQAVVNGYQACNQMMKENIVLAEFAIGREHRPYLLGIFVEHALNRIPESNDSFFSELRLNKARNKLHLRLFKGGLSMTSHFMGQRKFRNLARPAKNRIALSTLNGDLFADENQMIDFFDSSTHIHCGLLHGGTINPEMSLLTIPTRDQKSISAACDLPIPEVELVQSEEIAEEAFRFLKKQAEEQQTNVSTKSNS